MIISTSSAPGQIDTVGRPVDNKDASQYAQWEGIHGRLALASLGLDDDGPLIAKGLTELIRVDVGDGYSALHGQIAGGAGGLAGLITAHHDANGSIGGPVGGDEAAGGENIRRALRDEGAIRNLPEGGTRFSLWEPTSPDYGLTGRSIFLSAVEESERDPGFPAVVDVGGIATIGDGVGEARAVKHIFFGEGVEALSMAGFANADAG